MNMLLPYSIAFAAFAAGSVLIVYRRRYRHVHGHVPPLLAGRDRARPGSPVHLTTVESDPSLERLRRLYLLTGGVTIVLFVLGWIVTIA
jgi:hypothetical protein